MARPRKSKFKITVLYNDGSSFEIRMSIDEYTANSFDNDDDLEKHIIKRSGFGEGNTRT
ncbi:hypothetical protein [Enterococcus rotai]|uniref:hypothetical protein n=1 Tax=Enterococcus rotai TaxID=118060 RepID=UPI0035C6A27B